MRTPLFLVTVLLASACGGTASETPWPKEPEDVDLGPAGEAERARGGDATRSANPDAAKPTPEADPAPGTRSDPVAP